MDRRYSQPQRPEYYHYDTRYDYGSEDEQCSQYYDHPRARAAPGEEDKQDREEQKSKQKESMTSWIGRVSTSQQAQLAATAIVSGAVVAGAILGYQSIRRHERVSELKSGIPEAKEGGGNKVRSDTLGIWGLVGNG